MEVPDKSWMNLRQDDLNYLQGVDKFIDFAVKSIKTDSIACPCIKCANRSYEHRTLVRGHLVAYEIRQSYTFWCFHGERRSSIVRNSSTNVRTTDNEEDHELANVVQETNIDNIIDENNDDQLMEDIINDLYPNVEASNNERHAM